LFGGWWSFILQRERSTEYSAASLFVDGFPYCARNEHRYSGAWAVPCYQFSKQSCVHHIAIQVVGCIFVARRSANFANF
tara:strand:+ start:133868 stop:134104 length:237 start_codon:yes stop_codon:yes gene_type:complete